MIHCYTYSTSNLTIFSSFYSQEYVTYDERGFVIKRGETNYNYNVFGQMESAYEAGRFSIRFHYEDVGRIIAKRDHR